MTATTQLAPQPEVAPRAFGLPFTLIDPEKQLEWVNGHAEVKEMAGARHSRIGVKLSARLDTFVEEHHLGAVYGPDATFTIGPRERIPDVSFVTAARIPPEGDPIGPWKIAPDLAVEIVSPNDLIEEVETKIREYFAAGVQQVWLVSPQLQTVSIYDALTKVTILQAGDELTSPALLPGFRCPVAALFQPIARN
ncbi:MAG: Uma2 family endonuclease [Acidobacteria bacterium]|nr:Uma2 family endonuclease [Acidobacteriota bacterium]